MIVTPTGGAGPQGSWPDPDADTGIPAGSPGARKEPAAILGTAKTILDTALNTAKKQMAGGLGSVVKPGVQAATAATGIFGRIVTVALGGALIVVGLYLARGNPISNLVAAAKEGASQ